jgi:choline dehydrogenase-like flavoprotein
MEIITRKTTGRVYDAVIVGSGAAGGMAAYVMANAGMNVLALEAGPKLDLYNSIHEVGAARMGDDPKTSVRRRARLHQQAVCGDYARYRSRG